MSEIFTSEPNFLPGAKLLTLATDGSIEINRRYWITLAQADGTKQRKQIYMRFSVAEADALLPASERAKKQVLIRAGKLVNRNTLVGEILPDSIEFGGAKVVPARAKP